MNNAKAPSEVHRGDGEILDCDGLTEFAPDLNVEDAFRLSLRDETGKRVWQWDPDTIRAFVAEREDAELAERAHRPTWAAEGEWDGDVVDYSRDMSNHRALIEQTLKRQQEGWAFLGPAAIYLPAAADGEYDLAGARSLIEDLAEAVAVLEGQCAVAPSGASVQGVK